jgi:hypothetical protein
MSTILHRLDFDVVLRKLISKAQAFSQRIHETSMVRFYSSVDTDDIVLMRQTMSRDGAFHEDTPNQSPPNIERRPNARQRSPMS